MKYRLFPLGDNAITIELGARITIETHQRVQQIASLLDKITDPWMTEYLPAFTTITVFYDPVILSTMFGVHCLPYDRVSSELERLLMQLDSERSNEARIVEIPVYYGGDFGPDLQFVAEHNSLTKEQVIEIHSAGEYLVYMIGFAPGFPYIGGMSKDISAPRRKSPRLKIPPRSVGIAGDQTGVYPIETPGGWQIIGRTPLPLFRPDQSPPTFLQAGDRIKFKSISFEQYSTLEEASR